jgi:MFS family permease
MDFLSIILSKPVLIGLHLGFAIIGIDAFIWLFGKMRDNGGSQKSMIITAAIGTISFVLSWIAGGYYYVIYYGTLVKPIIKSGLAPWAHNIIMEAKEHIFLFIFPLSMTVLFITFLKKEGLDQLGMRKFAGYLSIAIAALGLLIGAMGFIISAAVRWG